MDAEPNFETACQWWPDLSNIWTPIGWKNHLFRFNVLFNGTIIAQPHLNKRTEQWHDQGVQLTFIPSKNGSSDKLRRAMPPFVIYDDGMVIQGWNKCATPVLWSEWSQDGILLRQEIFAHVLGAREVATGIEPLFAWIRLSIHETCPALPLEESYGFLIKINAPHISTAMELGCNIKFHSEMSLYPRALVAENKGYDADKGYRILEENGKVRLGIAPNQICSAELRVKDPTERDSLLYIEMNATETTHVDLLLPMLPTNREIFDEEVGLGYESALRESELYWSSVPETAAYIETPEEHINQTIKYGLKFAEIIAEKNPAEGYYSLLTGSFTYGNVWATPNSMTLTMLLDTLGYHFAAEKYLETFKYAQGTVVPPSAYLKPHPGYLGAPKNLAAIDWLSDHGAILYAISEHGLLTGDTCFIKSYTDTIVKACDFIKDARINKDHEGVFGIMPPAVATDRKTQIQAVWNDGWTYKGYTTAIKLLKKISHSRADEFARDAQEYKQCFLKAFREKYCNMPQWIDTKGQSHHLVPTAITGDKPDELRHAFYLDTGPLFLVFAGLMDAEDEVMRTAILWFREGPQTKFFRRCSNPWQVPCLDHEMSSCEPCYSWNVFHSHQLNDRKRFLEGMYSLFAGYISRKTYTVCETRGGIYGLTPALLPVYMARLAIVDDQIREGELHILRLIPLVWLRADRETKFENLPTEFGPVTVKVRLSSDNRTLHIILRDKFRESPKRLVIHVPPVETLSEVSINGKTADWDGISDTLNL